MPLRIHHQSFEVFLEQGLPLVRKYKLTIYDSAYLILAKNTGLPLATGDGRMRDTAIAEGVEVLK